MSMTAVQSINAGFDAEWRAAALAGLDHEARDLVDQTLEWVIPRFAATTEGEAMASHAAGTVLILASLHTDATTRAAALIANTPEGEWGQIARGKLDPLGQRFGDEVAQLVRGYHALVRVAMATRESGELHRQGETPQVEKTRKMMLAMAADLRIVLMRLASRLQTLRWHASAKQPPERPLALETLDLYAPLASRLGVWQIKWELEDLAFRFLEPVRYKEIASLLDDKRVAREAFIAKAIEQLRQDLQANGVEAEISGRPKHIYSIWNKMQIKRLDFSDLYDINALRIIVEDVRTCYTALALVHERYSPITQEFDDYIAKPKPNGYRSLHTVVSDGAHRPFEIQIRTREMHEFAEFGVAAHWRYKEAGAKGGQAKADSDYDRRLAWLRQLLAWSNEQVAAGAAATGAEQTSLIDEDRIYVLTPQARVVELPRDATPVDFAYYVHSDLGHRCRGARVDGQIVPLHTRLRTGQTVEIIAAKAGGPSRDWLNPQLGYLASGRSR
ncbi:MAG: bifunctional (p)ppGpp synthetase/guanosine-3',5'-bis(diphosphate) 3'-pyrophosphohydrolase, partial [Pigmentiphaga sp.]